MGDRDALIRQLQGGLVPTYTAATMPIVTGPVVVYVSDAVAGSRFQGWDVTAGAWVALG